MARSDEVLDSASFIDVVGGEIVGYFVMRVAAVVAMLAATLPQAPASAPELLFHHLHLRDSPPAFLIEFYERLFDPSVTTRMTFAGSDGLQMGSRLLLVSPTTPGKQFPAALWHFGWGKASLGETYLAHARREVAWEPPLPPESLHIHLRSILPARAAMWYRDRLGARAELPPVSRRTGDPLPPPEHRMPGALVHIGGLPLLIYPTEGPLLSSIGQRIEHLAFACADLEGALAYLNSKNVELLSDVTDTAGVRTAMIVGPDQMPIELVESKR